ncbi:MAG: ATP-binding cassette domain-containing protein [Lacunisphaera sp.]|nr:ATP-binding cassette domain-containing protein [Lacunisphaera sp.]
MALLSLLDVSLAFGGPSVLDHVNFQVNAGERLCLLGRNGAGKSTLMKLIAGEMQPDTGQIFRKPGAHFARLVQEVPADLTGSVHDIVSAGLRSARGHEEDWEREVRLEDLLKHVGLDSHAEFSALSGGLKRRVLLAQALASQPDLLLLDEPTNHLDLASILWLEEFLLSEKIGLFFVTHDRAFLKKLATRIVELDRGVITNWDCDYDTFLVRRQDRLEAEERMQALADKKLAQEEEWIRRGVRAQRSRATARINQLHVLRAERRARRATVGNVKMSVNEAIPSGLKVVDAEKMYFAYHEVERGLRTRSEPVQPVRYSLGDGGRPGSTQEVADNSDAGHKWLVKGFSTTIIRGDKIGLIGPNGAGKTTLIKLLLGQLAPTRGVIKHGTNLEVVHYDQLRAQIEDDRTVADNIANGNTHLTIAGRTRHVISYLQDFLFTPDRARTPARVLSGGERNRLLLARLFTKPANVLVLDEPTNDLDIETLDLLEDLLVEFPGTVLIVSHDREFLDEVVTSSFVFEGDGVIGDYVGGYTDWQHEKQKQAMAAARGGARPLEGLPSKGENLSGGQVPSGKPRKLSTKEQKELESLPAKIEALEQEQAQLTVKLADPAFYKKEPQKFTEVKGRLDALEREHAGAFARWEELEARTERGSA